jgi:Right handed beta helix region
MIADMRRPILAALLAALSITSLPAQRLNQPYKAAPGVPTPSFGISESAGQATYFVNNTHPAATDTDNARGSADRPRSSVPTSLPAGAVVEVRGGPYSLGNIAWSAAGTREAPVFVRGVGDPVMRGDRLAFAGSYLIVEGFVFDGMPLVMSPTMSYLSIRYSTVRNWSPRGNSAAVVPAGSNIVIFGNEIHNNGDPVGSEEADVHGIKAEYGTSQVWIVHNHIHHNGGDGIQLGNATSPEPWPRFIYIANNVIHEDRENAVDIKKARDVIVSSNTMYGYDARSSSAGEVVITHDNAQRVWIVNNAAVASRQGLVCSGADGYYVIGNTIVGIRHHPNDTKYDPNSLFRTSGILTYNTVNSLHVNNTVWESDAGISYAGGNVKTEIVNNIVGRLAQPTYHIAVGSSTAAGVSVMKNNLIEGTPRIKWGGSTGACSASDGCINADPQFVEAPKNFRLRPGSPAIDAGADHPVYQAFRAAYGVDLAIDVVGTPRPQGPRLDIGSVEFPTGTPAAPRNPRIVP